MGEEVRDVHRVLRKLGSILSAVGVSEELEQESAVQWFVSERSLCLLHCGTS